MVKSQKLEISKYCSLLIQQQAMNEQSRNSQTEIRRFCFSQKRNVEVKSQKTEISGSAKSNIVLAEKTRPKQPRKKKNSGFLRGLLVS